MKNGKFFQEVALTEEEGTNIVASEISGDIRFFLR